MSLKVLFISDFFEHQIECAGAEKNDSVLLKKLEAEYDVEKINSYNLTEEMVREKKQNIFVFSNFTLLKKSVMSLFINEDMRFIIYEHDHKYVSTRDPSRFRNFVIPERNLINTQFYKKANFVVVLSKICKEIIENNLQLDNVHNIGCSLWSKGDFDSLKTYSQTIKTKNIAIIDSNNQIKGKQQAIEYCEANGLEFDLVKSPNYESFLKTLSAYKTLVFIPQVLETFSRLAVESKCLGCKLITRPRLLGCASESLFSLSGAELIKELKDRNDKALELFKILIDSLGNTQ